MKGNPRYAVATPAMTGPIRRAPLKAAELSAMAFRRCPLPTISMTNDCLAGMSKALTVPKRKCKEDYLIYGYYA